MRIPTHHDTSRPCPSSGESARNPGAKQFVKRPVAFGILAQHGWIGGSSVGVDPLLAMVRDRRFDRRVVSSRFVVLGFESLSR
ncbi:hypothetical protein [Natronobacterium gregoryi]|uniref:Uncharacterized protein n=1 Tax=Natronobacterium gregoryi (strain ATCC 43098 / DSM 3393 / CCM 3738 / CIP 104747 / IAM 13177 / JCM 8860 / NBRC 102187 / NCIMB 2189 / SP2) TaxID=797304 RepID=L9YEC5_NATGS|nr:hypothetical protein [Natronobacterium gregoryi]ELY71273.1 hypothetical protein C490_05052 [Natronobacterium gregoryi SP2]PLK18767.1 hypothetical protein CYV19_17065 [Natronobacterium gregoryi SP2]